MKNVLFIEYFFPPLLGHWRSAALARFLPEFGWEPIVISAAQTVRYEKDYDLLNEIPETLRVYRVPHPEPPLSWQYLRHKLKVAADFPDYYKAWYSPACKEARRILQREKVQLIYTVLPTYTSAFVAMKLKKEFNLPWVADFLDGWAVNDFLNRHYDQNLIKPLWWFHQRRIRNAERSILQSADRVAVIHWHVRERWRELHGIDGTKIRVVTDGYDESVFLGLRERVLYDDRLTIVFLGSFYPAFAKIVVRFARVLNEIDPRAQLVFIGRGSAAAHKMNLPNSTCILHVPRRMAIEFGLGSDFLFVVMPPYAKWIPSKIYDYLRIGKPILALVPRDGDAARIVQESKGGFILDFDEKIMKRQLEAIFQKWKEEEFRSYSPDQEYVAMFERRKITQQMARVFDEVVGEE